MTFERDGFRSMKLVKRTIIIALLFFITARSISACEGTMIWEYSVSAADKVTNLSLTIRKEIPFTIVTVDEKDAEKVVVVLKNDSEIQNATYTSSQGEVYLEVVYDYELKEVSVSGVQNAKFPLEEQLFDNNAALFYIFGLTFPDPNGELAFSLLQSKSSKINRMVLKNLGMDSIIVCGKTIEAFKFEMSLSSSFARLFWPHKYLYWYSADGVLLKYEGLNENGDVETVTLINQISK